MSVTRTKKALDLKRRANTSCRAAAKSEDKTETKDKKAAETKVADLMVSLFDEPPEEIAAPADAKAAEQVTA